MCERLFAMQEQVRLPEVLLCFQNFRFILPRIPILILTTLEYPTPIEIWPRLGTLSFDYSRIPPPPHVNLTRTWNLSFDYSRIPLLLQKWKFGQDLGLWILTTLEYHHHPTPTPLEYPPNVNLARTWNLSFDYSRIPLLPQNGNLARTWDFEFWLL